MDEKAVRHLREQAARDLRNAQAMKERFPDLLASYTAEEVREKWERYSSDYWAAGWISADMDEDEERVRQFTMLYPSEH